MNHAAPWTIIKTESAVIGARAILDADGYTVCNPSPMGAANAALIAAAPALYAALDQLHLAVTMRPTGQGGLSLAERAALDNARAVLAVAGGAKQ